MVTVSGAFPSRSTMKGSTPPLDAASGPGRLDANPGERGRHRIDHLPSLGERVHRHRSVVSDPDLGVKVRRAGAALTGVTQDIAGLEGQGPGRRIEVHFIPCQAILGGFESFGDLRVEAAEMSQQNRAPIFEAIVDRPPVADPGSTEPEYPSVSRGPDLQALFSPGGVVQPTVVVPAPEFPEGRSQRRGPGQRRDQVFRSKKPGPRVRQKTHDGQQRVARCLLSHSSVPSASETPHAITRDASGQTHRHGELHGPHRFLCADGTKRGGFHTPRKKSSQRPLPVTD